MGSRNLLKNGSLTPAEVVSALDRYIIAQDQAKRAVAIALRNRWRRLRVPEKLRDEITPKNIIMIGPTGVGKTEISRRLAKLAKAPFVKVEASKFTEVGYVGRDVESIVRELMESAVNMVREEEQAKVLSRAEELAEDRLLDHLVPGSRHPDELIEEELFWTDSDDDEEDDYGELEEYDDDEEFDALMEHAEGAILQDDSGVGHIPSSVDPSRGDAEKEKRVAQAAESERKKWESNQRTREKFRKMLRNGKIEDREVEIQITKQVSTQMQFMAPQGMGEIEGQIKDMFANMIPKQKERKLLAVRDARKVLIREAQERLIDPDKVVPLALERVEQTGIVFIDEIDKVCGKESEKGPDVSREGVQRDLLPLVEGCTVGTKYGPVRTDHVLFIASGAFHKSKPSDLMPEFQGRFPIRVELTSLTPDHFERILVEPENALTTQYCELLKTEGVTLQFTPDAVREIAELTAEVNSETENIGARRLHTLLEKLLESLSFDADQKSGELIKIDREFVKKELHGIVKNRDLSRFIL